MCSSEISYKTSSRRGVRDEHGCLLESILLFDDYMVEGKRIEHIKLFILCDGELLVLMQVNPTYLK